MPRRSKHCPKTIDDLFIVGLDAEWQSERNHNRLLSFQWSVLYRRKESAGISFYGPQERPKLTELIRDFLTQSRQEGLFKQYPERLILVSHFTLAELSILKDFNFLKKQFDSIRGSFTTLTKPFKFKITDANRNQRTYEVYLRDSYHLTPQGAKLEVLGQIHGVPKVELPDGAIENMEHLLATNRELFTEYAITDARIAAIHARAMAELNLELTGVCAVPTTLGSLAIAFTLEHWRAKKIDKNQVLGKEEVDDEKFDRRAGRTKKTKESVFLPILHEYEPIAVEAYHGGRNEAFFFGPTQIDDWLDVDLKGAYSTSLASVGMPKWHETQGTVELRDFHTEIIGAARIRFRFPATVRFPTLPVRLPNNLIFPQEGVTYASAPEIELAHKLGASIEILSGYVIPMDEEIRPFEAVISECTHRRNKAKQKSDDLNDRLFKEIVNSLYGKVAQGLREKRVFDSRSGELQNLPPSKITQPFIAGHVTGLVRAALGELMNSVGINREIISVTTDGFITNAGMEELLQERNGAACCILRKTRNRLVGDPSILEVKHTVQQVLCFRTRGQATLIPGRDEEPPLLAKAGIKPPRHIVGKDRQNIWMVGQFFERDSDTTFRYETLPTIRKLYESEGDLVTEEHERKLGMEFDFKRKPSIRYMSKNPGHENHLAFHTVPYASEEECRFYRESWKDFERSGRCLKTLNDLRDFEEFLAGEQLSRSGINRSSEGLEKVAMRQFLRRLVRGNCGLESALEGCGYAEFADHLCGSGTEVTENDLKNAKRSNAKVMSHSVPYTPEVLELVRFLKQEFPEWESGEMLVEDFPLLEDEMSQSELNYDIAPPKDESSKGSGVG